VKTVVAAIDGSLATTPVLASAHALGAALHAGVSAVHVRTDGVDTPRRLAHRADVPLRILTGPVLRTLIEVGADPDVVALVIGARGLAPDPRVLGGTATAVATTLARPVVVVPPDAEPRAAFKRVLVPLEGNQPTSAAPRSLIRSARGHELDVVVLHVLGPDTIPSFMDQPQHWHGAWTREFVARYCPWDVDDVDVLTRVGRREQLIAQSAREYDCDLIALGWSQNLTEGRARVVRATLRRSRLPVALIPLPAEATAAVGLTSGRHSNTPH